MRQRRGDGAAAARTCRGVDGRDTTRGVADRQLHAIMRQKYHTPSIYATFSVIIFIETKR